jgi:hypothetical protein
MDRPTATPTFTPSKTNPLPFAVEMFSTSQPAGSRPKQMDAEHKLQVLAQILNTAELLAAQQHSSKGTLLHLLQVSSTRLLSGVRVSGSGCVGPRQGSGGWRWLLTGRCA